MYLPYLPAGLPPHPGAGSLPFGLPPGSAAGFAPHSVSAAAAAADMYWKMQLNHHNFMSHPAATAAAMAAAAAAQAGQATHEDIIMAHERQERAARY